MDQLNNGGGMQDAGSFGGAADGGQGGQQAGTQPQPSYVGASQYGAAPAEPGLTGKWAGKSPSDIAKAYDELEKKLGSQGNEMGNLKKQLEQWQQFGQGWDPYLKLVGHNPQALVQALQRAAQAAQAQGNPQQAQQLQRQAQRAWEELIDPREQGQWIKEHVTGAVQPVQQQMQQGFQEIVQRGTEYINQYMDLALRAIQAKFENPNLDIGKYLQEAVNFASGRYDPMELAKRQLLAPADAELREQLRKEEREKLVAEMQNQRLTTGVGAGGPPRALRPTRAAAPQPAAAPAARLDDGSAREAFIGRMRKEHPGLV